MDLEEYVAVKTWTRKLMEMLPLYDVVPYKEKQTLVSLSSGNHKRYKTKAKNRVRQRAQRQDAAAVGMPDVLIRTSGTAMEYAQEALNGDNRSQMTGKTKTTENIQKTGKSETTVMDGSQTPQPAPTIGRV